MNTEEFRKELPGLEKAFQAWMRHQGIDKMNECIFLSYALAASMCRATHNPKSLSAGLQIIQILTEVQTATFLEQNHEQNPNTSTNNRT